mmetsp:Transcript_23356/g.76031  ORF Transcript_23356/g.76031 Transcript_23356/m.76031 type:complete len:205 (+) Transcript_23356:2219-2833(+)
MEQQGVVRNLALLHTTPERCLVDFRLIRRGGDIAVAPVHALHLVLELFVRALPKLILLWVFRAVDPSLQLVDEQAQLCKRVIPFVSHNLPRAPDAEQVRARAQRQNFKHFRKGESNGVTPRRVRSERSRERFSNFFRTQVASHDVELGDETCKIRHIECGFVLIRVHFALQLELPDGEKAGVRYLVYICLKGIRGEHLMEEFKR